MTEPIDPITRELLFRTFKNPRAVQAFVRMQEQVQTNSEATTALAADTLLLKDAAFVTLSANAELPNEHVLSFGEGLAADITQGSIRLKLTDNVPRVDGGFRVRFITSGDAMLALPPSGTLVNQEWVLSKIGTDSLPSFTGNAGKVLAVNVGETAAEWVTAGGVSDGDKGDITVSSGGTAWAIDAGAVTFAKMQDASGASVLVGRGAGGGAGDFQEITLGTNLSMSGTTLNATGGGVNSGVTTVNFGAFPGASDAKTTITGQAGILAGSKVKAYVMATATADHTADEHWVETLEVMAGNIVPGTGFDIYAKNTGTLSEPVLEQWANTRLAGPGTGANQVRPVTGGGTGTRLYGEFTVGWEWV